jgi:hypothetical protein
LRKASSRLREVKSWEDVYRRVEKLKRGFKLSHDGLNKL